jgi:Ca2+-binding RTX toxin-like protein
MTFVTDASSNTSAIAITGVSNAINTITGSQAAGDTLTGGGKADTFIYSADTYLFDASGNQLDTIAGGDKTDTISFTGTGGITIAATDTWATTGIEKIAMGAVAATGANSFSLDVSAETAGITTIDLSADTSTTGANTINVSEYVSTGVTITGVAGSVDTITGGGGNDTLVYISDAALFSAGNAVIDSIDGGAGDDTLSVGTKGSDFDVVANDSWARASNIESIVAVAGTGSAKTSIALNANAYAAGLRTVDIAASTATTTNTVDASNITGGGMTLTGSSTIASTVSGGSGADTITGGILGDTLNGNGGADIINGGAGGDTITGGAGVDTIDGGADNDTITGGAGADNLTGGAGDDTFAFASSSEFITATASSDAIVDTISGGDGTDTISVTGSISIGAAGVDSLSGLTDVEVFATAGTATGAGTDLAHSINLDSDGALGSIRTFDFEASLDSDEDVTLDLTGTTVAVTVKAGDGGSTITTGTGADTIYLGVGDDTVDGGAGNDTYVINALTDLLAVGDLTSANTDSGTDTTAATKEEFTDAVDADLIVWTAGDKLDVSGIDADTGVAGTQDWTLSFDTAASAGTTGSGTDGLNEDPTDHYIVVQRGTWDATNGDFTHDESGSDSYVVFDDGTTIATLFIDGAVLTASDFVL